uniref:Uncharacterized protein n=1 Tax=Panagrolaimus sp. JU765 TaxID=591449 RepID=A0AC34PZD1_9BILA
MEPLFPNNQIDKTGILRNIFHFILTWPTILGYCFIEVFAFFEVTIRGKEVCNHGASKKEGLVSTTKESADFFKQKLDSDFYNFV